MDNYRELFYGLSGDVGDEGGWRKQVGPALREDSHFIALRLI